MRLRIPLLIIFSVLLSGPIRAQEPVHFACPNLKAAVEDKLWIDDPTAEDMLSLYSISHANGGITDLTGLEYAKNLQTIYFHLNEISDISPLSRLTNLQKLSLGRNKLQDLSPLADLTRLYHLDLHGNQLSNISVISRLTNLETLLLRWNRISDVSALSGLTKLTYLTLHNNQISDISPLSGLTKLQTLYLYNNQVSRISALSGMTEMEVLSLPNNQIGDISALSGLTKLTELYLHHNQINDISALGGLTNLSMLWLHDNPLNQEACDTYIPQILANNPAMVELEYDACTAEYGLIISSSSGGSVNTPGEGTFPYAHGTPVSVSAMAYDGHQFVNWTGTAVTAGKVSDPEMPNTMVTVDGNYTLIANFSEGQTDRPSVSTYEAKDVTDTSARLEAYLINKGPEVYTGWFRYWIKGNRAQTELNTAHEDSLQASQLYTLPVNCLSPETTYCFQAIVENPGSLAGGNIQEFTTLAAQVSPANLIHVDDDAINDPGPYDLSISDPQEDGTEDHPYDSVQEAIEQAQDLDQILVHAGRYYETLNLIGKCLTLTRFVPGTGPLSAYPVIDAQNRGTVATFNNGENPNCILSGLVLTGGLDRLSGAVACVGASPTIRNCLIVDNHSTGPTGAIIYCEDSQALFQNLTVTNNVCATNSAAFRFANCDAIISNTILWGNAATEIAVVSGHDPTVVYSNVEGSWPGVGNTATAPLFALPDDYHLLSEMGRWSQAELMWKADELTSPCIDAGDPSDAWAGEASPHGARINMGAYGGTEQASFSLHLAPMIALWAFDESSGSTATDTIGNNHGTVHGASWTQGRLDGALQFDGIDDYVDCGNDPSLAPDTLTVAMWISAQATSGSRTILSKGAGDKARDLYFELFGARYPTFSFGNGIESIVLYSSSPIPLNEWTHIALTRAEADAVIYVNGTRLVSQVFDFAPSTTDKNLIIGGGSAQPFQGTIDDIQIYNSVLFEEDINALVTGDD